MSWARKKGPTWYIGFKDEHGEQHEQSSAARTKAEGRLLAAAKEVHCEHIRLGLAPPPPPATTLRQLCERYLRDVAPSKRSHKTITGRINRHIVPALGDRYLDNITPADVEALCARTQAAGYAAQTAEHLRRLLRVLFNFAAKARLFIGENPAAAAERVPVPRRGVKYLDAALVGRVIAAARDWRQCFLALGFYTGMRKGEILGLVVERDIHLERNYISVTHSYVGPTKSDEPRVVPIAPELRQYLEVQMARVGSRGYLFRNRRGRPMSRHLKAEVVLRRALKRAGIIDYWVHVCRRKGCGFTEQRAEGEVTPCPRCSFKLWPKAIPPQYRFHDSRATASTYLYFATGDERLVADVIGHAHIATNRKHYTAMLPEHLARAALKYAPATDPVPTPAPAAAAAPKRSGGKR